MGQNRDGHKETPNLKASEHPHVDQRGLDWRQENDARWERLHLSLDVDGMKAALLPLPDFEAEKSEHVKRRALGSYFHERRSGTIHRAATADADCGLSDERDGTWYHFWHEAVRFVPDAECCPVCLGEGG